MDTSLAGFQGGPAGCLDPCTSLNDRCDRHSVDNGDEVLMPASGLGRNQTPHPFLVP